MPPLFFSTSISSSLNGPWSAPKRSASSSSESSFSVSGISTSFSLTFVLRPGTFCAAIRAAMFPPAVNRRGVFGAGRLPGGPRAWPEGIWEAYWRTLSTDMRRVGARSRAAPAPLRGWVLLRPADGRSRELVFWGTAS